MLPGIALLALTLLAVSALPIQVSAQSVTPTIVPGNPSCADMGYTLGFKPQPEPPPSGTYTFPDGINTVNIVRNGDAFDWNTAAFGMDAVIVKGGPNANVYVYDPPAEAFSDVNLRPPSTYGLSHIEFCYDYELGINKDANPSWTRDISWTIDKTVTPAAHAMFAGESSVSTWTVEVVKTVDEAASLDGNIYITNNTPFDATVTSVIDQFQGANLDVVCPGGLPQLVASGASLTCTYSKAYTFPGPEPTDGTNEVTVVSTGVAGGTATAPVDFDLVVNGYDDINVTDTNGMVWATGSSQSWTYDQTFDCSSNPADYTDGSHAYIHPNTATITETSQSADADVDVTCYAPLVSKDASTSFDRSWEWTISKSADQTSLLLSSGQLFEVNYQVDVNGTYTDDNIAVTGTITVQNPHPTATMTVALSDVLSDGTPVTLCADAAAFQVPAAGSNTCAYSAAPAATTDLTNTATATMNAIDFNSPTVDVLFGGPVTETDECIDVEDTNTGVLGTVCGGDAPATFNYSLWFGRHPDADVYLECGENTHPNVASFLTNDTGTAGDAAWTVDATVTCPPVGCTLTPGYWKTHSEYGPAPYDDTWALLASGADTPFFYSDQTYYEVLWTPPKGNAYYNLSFHYIAAELNMLNGTSVPPEVQSAFDEATDLFETYTPAEIDDLKGKNGKDLRNQFIDLAGILGAYNEGDLGPGHCSEETPVDARAAAEAESTLSPSDEPAKADDVKDETPTQAPAEKTAEPVAETRLTETLPTEYGLGASYPNPFRTSTTLEFYLPETSNVSLRVYDVLGREVALLVSGTVEAGTHQATWDARHAAAGTYVVLFEADGYVESRSVLVMK